MLFEFFLSQIMSHPYLLIFSIDGHVVMMIIRILLSKTSESTFQQTSA